MYGLECAHHRQLLTAWALNEHTLLLSGLPFPRNPSVRDVYIDDLVVLSFLYFSDVRLEARAPSRFGVPTLCMTICRCRPTQTSEEDMSTVSLVPGLPLERPVSLMFTTMQIASAGVNRNVLKRLLAGCRREAFASVDVADIATPPCHFAGAVRSTKSYSTSSC